MTFETLTDEEKTFGTLKGLSLGQMQLLKAVENLRNMIIDGKIKFINQSHSVSMDYNEQPTFKTTIDVEYYK